MSAAELQPVQSRRTSPQTMAARGLKPAAQLAQGKPCGTRTRYFAGCRCAGCRKAIATYERERRAARARGESNGLVSAAPARAHLAWLSTQGVGRRAAADAAKVSSTVVHMICDGMRLQVREQTARRLLAVTPIAAFDGARTDAAPTWKLLDQLIADGYSRAQIARELLGRPARALQLSRKYVTVQNAARVRKVWERLVYAGDRAQREAAQQLQALREEGYRPALILRRMADLAAQRGWPAPTLGQDPRGRPSERLRAQEAQLLATVHSALLDEGDTA